MSDAAAARCLDDDLDLLSFLQRLIDGRQELKSQEQCLQDWMDRIEVLSHVPWFVRMAEQSLSMNSNGHIGDSDSFTIDCALTSVLLKKTSSDDAHAIISQLISCPAACERLPLWAASLCNSISNQDLTHLKGQCITAFQSESHHGSIFSLGLRSAIHLMNRCASQDLDPSALIDASIDLFLKHQDEKEIESLLLSSLSSSLLPISTISRSILLTLQSVQPPACLRLICLLLPNIARVIILEGQEGQGPSHLTSLVQQHLAIGLRSQRDAHSRSRAMHALQSLKSPLVSILGLHTEQQWVAFTSIAQSLEQRVYHLIQPVWDSHFPQLLSPGSSHTEGVSIILTRAAFHSNVNVRRLALGSVLGLKVSNSLEDESNHEALLLSLLPSFDHEALIGSDRSDTLQSQLVCHLRNLTQGRGIKSRVRFITPYLSRVVSPVEGQTMKLRTIQYLTSALLKSMTNGSGNENEPSNDSEGRDDNYLYKIVLSSLTVVGEMNPAECRRETQANLINLYASSLQDTSSVVRILEHVVHLVAAALPYPSHDPQISELSSNQRINDERSLVEAMKAAGKYSLFSLLPCLKWDDQSRLEASKWASGVTSGISGKRSDPLITRSLLTFICPHLDPSRGLNPDSLASCLTRDPTTLAFCLTRDPTNQEQDLPTAWVAQCLADSLRFSDSKSRWYEDTSRSLVGMLLPLLISSQLDRAREKERSSSLEWDLSLLSSSISVMGLMPDLRLTSIKDDLEQLDQSLNQLKGSLEAQDPSSSSYLVSLCFLLSLNHTMDKSIEANLLNVCCIDTSHDHCLSLRALARRLLLSHIKPPLSKVAFVAVVEKCSEDFKWASDQALEDTVQALTLALDSRPADMTGDADEDWGLTDTLIRMVRDLPYVLVQASKGGKVSLGLAPRAVALIFHPSFFEISSTRNLLIEEVIPMVLEGAMGVRMSMMLASHLSRLALQAINQGRAEDALVIMQPSRIASFISHGYFSNRSSPKPPSSTATGKKKKKQLVVSSSPELLLPSRVALCAFLDALAHQPQEGFIDQVASCLLSALRSLGGAREGGQSSAINSTKIRTWQALCLIARGLSAPLSIRLLNDVWQSSLLESTTEQANVRPFIQLFVCKCLSRDKTSIKRLLLPALADYSRSSYQVSVSVCLVALQLMKELKREGAAALSVSVRDECIELNDQLMKALLPWSLHHRHAVRVPVQVMLHRAGGQQDSFMQPIGSFLESNSEMNKMMSGSASKAAHEPESLDTAMSFESLYSCRPGVLSDGESDVFGLEWPLHARDRLPEDLVTLVPLLLKRLNKSSYQQAAAEGMKDKQRQAECGDENEQEDEGEGDGEGEGGEGDKGQAPPSPLSFHQLRPTLDQSMDWLTLLQEDVAADKAEALVQARTVNKGLVVVGSLLDNLPNVAGLCRTAESMNCESLVISSKLLAASDEFKRQSVTSERWIRLLEVGPQDLPAFIKERRDDGYIVVAIEQASHSISLQHYRFPRKCVMILGNEQNGVPTSLLDMVDVCVEIPMLGVTRSMNAHVTGAMCIWSYVQQHQIS